MKDFAKNAIEITKEIFVDLKKNYEQNKQTWEEEGKGLPDFYKKAISISLVVFDIPSALLQRIFRGPFGTLLGFIYKLYIMPYRSIISMFDIRVYKSIITTFIAILRDCVPNALKVVIEGIMNTIMEVVDTLKKFVRESKNLIIKKVFLLEEEFKQEKEGLFSRFKNAFFKVLSPVKGVLFFFLKKGLGFLEKMFLRFMHPICSCLSKSNKLKVLSFSLFRSQSLQNFIAMASKTFELSSDAVNKINSVFAVFSSAFVFLGQLSFAFMICGLLSMLGDFLMLKNIFIDLADTAALKKEEK